MTAVIIEFLISFNIGTIYMFISKLEVLNNKNNFYDLNQSIQLQNSS